MNTQSIQLDEQVTQIINDFHPISLLALQQKAELLERRDNKYILDTDDMLAFLNVLKADFDVLDIDGIRQFHYLSEYFDSSDFQTHFDHNQGRRRRVKVRLRHYLDHELRFLEVKVKGFRNLTQKHRIPISAEQSQAEVLKKELRQFCDETIESHYDEPLPYRLKKSIDVRYHRITLVAKAGEERITIDNRIIYEANGRIIHLNDNKWIVEVKSSTGLTEVDRWLFTYGKRPVSRCSKYCMGINLLKLPEKNNVFSAVLRRHFDYPSLIEQ